MEGGGTRSDDIERLRAGVGETDQLCGRLNLLTPCNLTLTDRHTHTHSHTHTHTYTLTHVRTHTHIPVI